LRTNAVFLLSYSFAFMARTNDSGAVVWENAMAGRLLVERSVDGNPPRRPGQARKCLPSRSVTVNLAESPLPWLFARGHLSIRQFDAGERLRVDFERARLGPRITMSWDMAPVARGRGGSAPGSDPTAVQIDSKARFDAALAFAGPGLSDILWRVVCAGEGMREAESALGWPARAGKLVLTIALDRVADFYRL
jgi:hypothetical protein